MKRINLNAKKVHFIGIGGISMSGLAEVLNRDGYEVSGSDDVKTQITDHLQNVGIRVFVPNAAANITDDIDLVVYTAAVKPENPEFSAAKAKGKTLIDRAELLGLMLRGYKYPICIAGTHGKTTTTSLMAEVLLEAELDPTISIGGHLQRDGTNYRVGESDYFLLEACEYSNSFHHWHPYVGVVLNIDADHLDFFGNFDGVVRSFRQFVQNIRPDGVLVIKHGTPGFDEVTHDIPCRVATFGEDRAARFWADNIKYDATGCASFDAMDGETHIAQISLPLPGRYNMQNALAALAAAVMLGIPPKAAAEALTNAKGVKRRFEYKGTYNDVRIVDDYAHHPTEIQACLKAAKNTGAKRVICIFQPHTYTRTRNHLSDFAKSFEDADTILLLPIFASREAFDPTISSKDLQEGIKANGGNVIHLNNIEEAVIFLQQNLMPGDLLITMGAGDVYFVGEKLLSL